jgi:hypothetical protein
VVEFRFDSIRNMALFTRLNTCAAVIVLAFCPSCTHQSVSLRPSIRLGVPATCVVQHEENLSAIAELFYGTNSFLTTHVLWHANPDIRNRGWIKAGETLTIPVLPDQGAHFSAGEIIHVCSKSIVCPPYGFDVVISQDGSALLPHGVKLEVVGLTPEQVTAAIERAYVPKIYVSLDLVAIRISQGVESKRRSDSRPDNPDGLVTDGHP